MLFNKQLFDHKPELGIIGDCYRTAISCILNLKPEEVPHFGELLNDQPDIGYNVAANDWLREFGYTIFPIAYPNTLEVVMENMSNYPELYYVLVGNVNDGNCHAVVGKGGEIINDPADIPSGIFAPCDDGHYWVEVIVPSNYNLKG